MGGPRHLEGKGGIFPCGVVIHYSNIYIRRQTHSHKRTGCYRNAVVIAPVRIRWSIVLMEGAARWLDHGHRHDWEA